MTSERSLGQKQISQRLADEIARNHPNSRHLFPDCSFLLYGPSDFDGLKIKSLHVK